MKQEEKDLLIKDLCGRLSHGVKCKILETNEVKILGSIQYDGENTLFDFWEDDQKIQYGYQLYLSEFKPCLLPISSMSKEHKKYIRDNYTFGATHELFDWLDKKKYDYRGLIEKGLAIDATGLNIY